MSETLHAENKVPKISLPYFVFFTITLIFAVSFIVYKYPEKPYPSLSRVNSASPQASAEVQPVRESSIKFFYPEPYNSIPRIDITIEGKISQTKALLLSSTFGLENHRYRGMIIIFYGLKRESCKMYSFLLTASRRMRYTVLPNILPSPVMKS